MSDVNEATKECEGDVGLVNGSDPACACRHAGTSQSRIDQMRMGGDAVIVEFIGPSGAGKTTLIRGVQRRLSERGIACRIRTTYMGLDWENPRTRRGFGKWRELG